MKLSKKGNKSSYVIGFFAASLSIITIISAMLLSIPVTNAETTTSNASISVGMSCSMAVTPGTGGTATSDGYSYSATVTPGVPSEISGSILTTTCNGPGNYSLYAIGYSGDSYDTPTNTQMISSAGSNNIVTGTATSGSTSNWAFKLASVSGTSAPTIVSPYSSYSNIPGDNFAKVATMLGTTGLASTSAVQAKYQVYASSTQPAGAYTGKVKYTMVYPNDAPAPKSKLYMQDMVASDCTTTATTVYDNRDGEAYLVQRLADGKCWMLDNLRLDITNSSILNSLTTSNTHTDTNSLTSLKTGNRSSGAQYATNGFAIWDSTHDSNYYNRASANSEYKDSSTTSYGLGSGKIGVYYNYCAASAGSYCYDNGAGIGDAIYDLCPTGWHMPTGSDTGEFGILYADYSSDANTFKNAFSAILSGFYRGGLARSQGSYGAFWSSSLISSDVVYYLYINPYEVDLFGNGDRYDGRSLRCLLDS